MAISVTIIFIFSMLSSLHRALAESNTPITTVRGGLTVSHLRIAGVSGNSAGITMGDEESQCELGVTEDGHFAIKGPSSSSFSLGNDGTVRIEAPQFQVSGLHLNGELIIGGVPQWRKIIAEDFTSEAVGWDNKMAEGIVTECAGIFMLGGYGKFSKVIFNAYRSENNFGAGRNL